MFAIMSRPWHPFLKAVIERVIGNIVLESETPGSFGNSSDRYRMLKLTSSYAYTDTIYPMLDRTLFSLSCPHTHCMCMRVRLCYARERALLCASRVYTRGS